MTHLQGSVLVLVVGTIVSFNGLLFRSAEDATPWEYLFFRGIGVTLIALPAMVIAIRRASGVTPRTQPIHVAAGIMLGLLNALFIVALDLTTVAFVLFTQTLSPVVAAYASWILVRERISRNAAIATAVSVLGVGVMVAGTITSGLSATSLVAFALPLFFGIYATLIRTADEIEPTVPVTIGGMTLIVCSTIVVSAQGGFNMPAQDALIGLIAGAAFLGIPLVMFNYAQRAVPSSETTLLLMAEVVLAPLWVWLFVDEQPEVTTLVGGAIILAAVAWLTVSSRPRRTVVSHP
ncbi:MAG: DMT family transporter [Acidimicrobiales bacterium]|nr:DMT family transporter [Acidimicrobiales bacterium]RZV44646.1 MAG: DMT family transporter [Acidimicrobiales bacterium]